jgi:hypothetical protein
MIRCDFIIQYACIIFTMGEFPVIHGGQALIDGSSGHLHNYLQDRTGAKNRFQLILRGEET